MPRRGLTEAMIVHAAVEIVEEKGYNNLSMRELATRLDVKPPALYNHISGIEELFESIARVAADRLNAALALATGEKTRDEGFIALCYAYRDFVLNSHEMYRALLSTPRWSSDDAVAEISMASIAPLTSILRAYHLSEHERIHMQRYIRSALHGFSWLEGAGFMRRSQPSLEETFEVIVQGLLAALLERERAGAVTADL